jgi:hypothetical protein
VVEKEKAREGFRSGPRGQKGLGQREVGCCSLPGKKRLLYYLELWEQKIRDSF